MKASLRDHFRSLRDAVPGPRRVAAAATIAQHIVPLSHWNEASAVLLYASFGSEVDTGPLLQAAWSANKRVGLPRVNGKELTVHVIDPATSLTPNRFGIPEPPATAERLSLQDIEIVVVPGVAFDRRGGRLGYGGGYYDRLLGTVSHAFRIGIAFDVQVVEKLPTTQLDVPMDLLVTPSGIHALPRRGH